MKPLAGRAASLPSPTARTALCFTALCFTAACAPRVRPTIGSIARGSIARGSVEPLEEPSRADPSAAPSSAPPVVAEGLARGVPFGLRFIRPCLPGTELGVQQSVLAVSDDGSALSACHGQHDPLDGRTLDPQWGFAVLRADGRGVGYRNFEGSRHRRRLNTCTERASQAERCASRGFEPNLTEIAYRSGIGRSADGSRAAWHSDGALLEADVSTGRITRRADLGETGEQVPALAYLPDGRLVFARFMPNEGCTFPRCDDFELHTVAPHGDDPAALAVVPGFRGVALSRRGDRALVVRADHAAVVELPSGRTLRRWVIPGTLQPTGPINAALSSDASRAAVATDEGLFVYGLAEDPPALLSRTRAMQEAQLAFAPDHRTLYAMDDATLVALSEGGSASEPGAGMPAPTLPARWVGTAFDETRASATEHDRGAPQVPPRQTRAQYVCTACQCTARYEHWDASVLGAPSASTPAALRTWGANAVEALTAGHGVSLSDEAWTGWTDRRDPRVRLVERASFINGVAEFFRARVEPSGVVRVARVRCGGGDVAPHDPRVVREALDAVLGAAPRNAASARALARWRRDS